MRIETKKNEKSEKINFIQKILNISEVIGDKILYYSNNIPEIKNKILIFITYIKLTILHIIKSTKIKIIKFMGYGKNNNASYNLNNDAKNILKQQILSTLRARNIKNFILLLENYINILLDEYNIKTESFLKICIGLPIIILCSGIFLYILYIIFETIVTFFILGVGFIYGIILFGITMFIICICIIVIISSS